MTDLDTRHAPKGELAARQLIEHIVASDDRIERHYLEIKSTLDLTTKKDQAKLVKFILGAANRMPDQAAKAFEGYGVMVVGASQGNASGIAPIEALHIQKFIMPFIGAGGPRYDLVRVPCENGDNDILVFLVDPPEWGQAPFICQKSGAEGLRDGAVYVRADGETREARGDELKQLIVRGQTAATHVNFDVRVIGAVRPIEIDNTSTLEEFISLHRARLTNALHKTKKPRSSSILDLSNSALGPSIAAMRTDALGRAFTEPESRKEDDYLAAIDEWEESVRQAWPEAVVRLIGALSPSVEVEITNREKTFFHDVELELHLEGSVFGTEAWSVGGEIDLDDLDIPGPPRAWGPKTTKWLDLGISAGALQHFTPSSFTGPSLSRTTWTNSGSVTWTFSVGQLRPKEVDASDDSELVLYLVGDHVESVYGSWELTARDHNEVYTGTLEVEVGQPIDLTREFRRILGIEERS